MGRAGGRALASMGPSMFVDGDLEQDLVLGIRLLDASMGPSMFVDGDQAVRLACGPMSKRFNGAVDVRRRRLAVVPRADARPPVASMGPSMFVDGDRRRPWPWTDTVALQWGRRCSSTETQTAEWISCRRSTASMGPSTIVDGDEKAARGAGARSCRFNGAVDVRRRRRRREPLRSPGCARCFNGAVDVRRRRHGSALGAPRDHASFNGAVDVRRRRRVSRATPLAPAPSASMGPSMFVDGDVPTPVRVTATSGPLQWGRRCSSTETRRPRRPEPSRKMSLQWGRRCSSTET